MTSVPRKATTEAMKAATLQKQKEPPDPSDPKALIATISAVDDSSTSGAKGDPGLEKSAKDQIRGSKGKPNSWAGDLQKVTYECNFILYGKFFGRTPPLELIKNLMPKIWNLSANCIIIDLARGFFAFKFADEEDYWKVFTGGPWFIRGQALSLVPWRNNFQPLKETISKVPIWIQFPGLPYEYMYNEVLPQIAAVIGDPIKTDDFTAVGTRAKFARICVLLDIKKPIQQGIWIESKEGKFFQSVAYENLSNICFKCGKVGHREESCRQQNEEAKTSVEENSTMADQLKAKESNEENLLGPWIQVQRRKKGNLSRKETNTGNAKNSFSILNNPMFEEGKSPEEMMKDTEHEISLPSKSISEQKKVHKPILEISSSNQEKVKEKTSISTRWMPISNSQIMKKSEPTSKEGTTSKMEIEFKASEVAEERKSKPIMKCLKSIEPVLKEWNKNSVGNLEKRLEDTSRKLRELEFKEEIGALSEEDILNIRSLSNKILALTRQIKIKWWSKNDVVFTIKSNWKTIKGLKEALSIYCDILMATSLKEKRVENIVKKEMNFFWGNKKSKGAKLIKWDIVIAPKGMGGLVVRDISVMRKVMVAKRLLPLLNEDDSNWSKIYKEKYGALHPWRSWGEKKRKTDQARMVSKCVSNLKDGLRISMKDGKKTSIWKDPWLSSISIGNWPTFINVIELERVKYGEKSRRRETIYSKALTDTIVCANMSTRSNKEISNKSMRNENLMKEDIQSELLCVDVAWRGGFKAGCGFIFVENKRCTLNGCNTETVDNPLHAELKSIWFGLDNVKKKGKMNFSIMSDCQVAVNILCKRAKVPWKLNGLVRLRWRLYRGGLLELRMEGSYYRLTGYGLRLPRYRLCSEAGDLVLQIGPPPCHPLHVRLLLTEPQS
ncbi:hypothetical protein Cni_G29029 [Canna indica]|uniref:CCHC-type domain-containing protein n=1 Tax=Canna indica TaxID=4628 RepID=A0AAQ3L513_9LILI|nr:hypothetical protein Cni_G29029 [Canna indica]